MTAHWPLTRSPHHLETSLPGVFAVGDVRSGNVKRVASAVGEGSIAVASISSRAARIERSQVDQRFFYVVAIGRNQFAIRRNALLIVVCPTPTVIPERDSRRAHLQRADQNLPQWRLRWSCPRTS